MKVTVLGCGAAYPRAGGACSGWLFQDDGDTMWVDAGNGTLSRLQLVASIADVDALVLTHGHADHISDVIPLMYALGFDDACRTLRVRAPGEVGERLRGMLGATSREMFGRVFDFARLDAPFEVGRMSIEPFATLHPAETYGLRVRSGAATVAYTSDTAAHGGLEEACRDADLLICEATYTSDVEAEAGIHMWAHEAGELAASAGVGRLVLTHIWPTKDPAIAVAEASAAFPGPVEAAVEGAVYEV